MKIVISFLICLALTDGAAISNVEPGIVCDPPCVVTYDADISKVEVETDVIAYQSYLTAKKYCYGMVVFGFILDILSLMIILIFPVPDEVYLSVLATFTMYAYGGSPNGFTGGAMANFMEKSVCPGIRSLFNV